MRKKQKSKLKVLKRIVSKTRICYFCGSTKRITRHHIIFRVFLQGKTLDDNIEYLCSKCHKKFHFLAGPVIDMLVQTLTKLIPTEANQIGFIRTDKKRRKKRNENRN